jgi:hypothetical protein
MVNINVDMIFHFPMNVKNHRVYCASALTASFYLEGDVYITLVEKKRQALSRQNPRFSHFF